MQVNIVESKFYEISKSLNFVINTGFDRRSTDINGNHPIKLRVWNRASKKVKLYSCNKFSDPSLFEKAMNHQVIVIRRGICVEDLPRESAVKCNRHSQKVLK